MKTGRNDIRYVVWAISKGSTRQHETTTNINIQNDEPKVIRDVDASWTPDTFFSFFSFLYILIVVFLLVTCTNDKSRLPTSPSITSTCQGAAGSGEGSRSVWSLGGRGSRPTRLGPTNSDWGLRCHVSRAPVACKFLYIYIYTLLSMTIHVLLLIKLLVFAMVIWVWDMRPIICSMACARIKGLKRTKLHKADYNSIVALLTLKWYTSPFIGNNGFH